MFAGHEAVIHIEMCAVSQNGVLQSANCQLLLILLGHLVLNSLTADDTDFGHMLPVCAVSFDDRFWASKKRWNREGGWA